MSKPKEQAQFSDEDCPKCGSGLLTADGLYWCSYIGGRESKACDYGLYEDIQKEDIERDRIAKKRLQ